MVRAMSSAHNDQDVFMKTLATTDYELTKMLINNNVAFIVSLDKGAADLENKTKFLVHSFGDAKALTKFQERRSSSRNVL